MLNLENNDRDFEDIACNLWRFFQCLGQEFLNGTSDLWKAGRTWRMTKSQGGLALPQPMPTLRRCDSWFAVTVT